MSLSGYRFRIGDTAPFVYYVEEVDTKTLKTFPFDLTNKTVNFDLVNIDTNLIEVLNEPASVTDASIGEIECIFPTNFTGLYELQLNIIDAEGRIAKFPEYDPLIINFF
jgi:hypothetical protein